MKELFLDLERRKDRASAPDPIKPNQEYYTTNPNRKQWVLTVKQRASYPDLGGKLQFLTRTLEFKSDLYGLTDLMEKLVMYDSELQFSIKTEESEELL